MVRHSPAASTRLTMTTGARPTAKRMRRVFFNANFPSTNLQVILWAIDVNLSIGFWPGWIAIVLLWRRQSCTRPSWTGSKIMELLHSPIFTSAVGPLFLAASPKGLVALEFDTRLPGQQTIRPNPRDLRAERNAIQFEESSDRLSGYVRELEEYFAVGRREFTFPRDLRGSDVQLVCWRELLSIPYGETRYYADIARAVGRPQGFRAVGMANNRNPVAIVVPCHRVIASDGTLCGYGGGLDLKRKLLELEGALSGT